MRNLPLIGLTGRQIKSSRIIGSLPVLAEATVDLYYAAYSHSVIAAGGLAMHIPIDVESSVVVEHLDGIVFSGGGDVDPSCYGAQRSPETEPPDDKRDRFELDLMAEAMKHEVPILGICRGMQLLNVGLGGTLHQHVPSHARTDGPVDAEAHSVEFSEGSLLRGFYGPALKVNSLHHQTVDRPGSNLTVVARADDETIEALEHDRLPAVAVQWHPEMLSTKASDPLFAWLITQASTRMRALSN